MDIRNVDLNLLVCLNALIIERNVTRAAERQGVSQPAMSAALAKLRDLFKDPLLVRTSQGMVLTRRATELGEPVAKMLREVEGLLQQSGTFDPATSHRTFRLQGTDYVESVLLAPLMTSVRSMAPSVKVVYRSPDPKRLAEDLDTGELDMGIGYIPSPVPHLRTQLVFRDRFVCLARRDHPAITANLTIEQYAALPHVQVLPRDSGMYASALDDALAMLNVARQVVLWEPSFLNVPELVATSDVVTTIPERVALRFVKRLPVQLIDPPVALPPIEVRMFWAEWAMQDPGHRWLRGLVHQVGEALDHRPVMVRADAA
jgi:DNA-binding transcriptional LysR family regulator